MNCCRAEGHKKRRTAKRIGTARFRKIKLPQTAAAQALPDRTVFSLSQRPITSDACCHRLETLPAAGASKPLSFSLNVLRLNLQQRMPGDFLSLCKYAGTCKLLGVLPIHGSSRISTDLQPAT